MVLVDGIVDLNQDPGDAERGPGLWMERGDAFGVAWWEAGPYIPIEGTKTSPRCSLPRDGPAQTGLASGTWFRAHKPK